MVGTRIVAKSLVLMGIVGLFLTPLTFLRRAPGEEDRLLGAPGVARRVAASIDDARVVEGFTATPLETYYPNPEVGPGRPPLSDKVNGGDVLYYEFGFRRLFARRLERPEDRRLYVEEYVMSDDMAAFGIWSSNRDVSDRPLKASVRAAGCADRAVLCHGDRYVSITAENMPGPAELEAFVVILGRVLAEGDPSAAPLDFPLAGVPRIAGSERLVCGPIGAQNVALPADLLGLSREAPAFLFSVPAGDSFVPAVAVPDGNGAWGAVAGYLGGSASESEFVAGAEDSRYFAARRQGFIVIGSMIATPVEMADFREALNR